MVVGLYDIRINYRIRLIVLPIFLKTHTPMIPKNILWLAPFICFLGGYFIVRSFFHVNTIPTPSVVGRSLHDAFTILSNHNLNIRLLTQKEDPDLPNEIGRASCRERV